MHGNRPEHPEVFKARMQMHKDAKNAKGAKPGTLDKVPAKPTGNGSAVKNEGTKAEAKDAAQDTAQTTKRRATFQHKAKAQAQADEKKPAKGVLTHLLPNQ